ncbi:MAG: WhiB family transcriptional regulator [Acidimicrobiales bacterium]
MPESLDTVDTDRCGYDEGDPGSGPETWQEPILTADEAVAATRRRAHQATVAWLMAQGAPDLPAAVDLLVRPTWMAEAACRGAGPGAFVPALGVPVAPARATCATCGVRAECLAYALADPEIVGVWGGTTARERIAIRRARAA